MQKLLPILAILLLIFSCGKDDDDSTGNQDTIVQGVDLTTQNNGTTTCPYAPFTLGSTFTYEQSATGLAAQEVTWEVTGHKEIDGEVFAEVSNFLGLTDMGYFNCKDGVYTIYAEDVPNIGIFELEYMKENVAPGTHWEQTINISTDISTNTNRYDFSFVEKLESHTVDQDTYDDVLHVQLDTYSSFTAAGETFEVLLSEENYFWAKGIGLVQVAGANLQMKLKSYDIQ